MPKKKTINQNESIKLSSLNNYLVEFSENDFKILKERAQRIAEEKKKEVKKKIKNVTIFQLSGERYAVETEHVLASMKLEQFVKLPTGPAFLFGLFNHRGEVLPIINLKVFFEMNDEKITNLDSIVVLKDENNSFGILVNLIEGVTEIDESSITKDIATIEGKRKEYLNGITSDGIIYLNAKKILNDKNLIINE